MPYSIRKSNSGFKVVNKTTGKKFSHKPLSKERAKRQLAALHINIKESFDASISSILKSIYNLK